MKQIGRLNAVTLIISAFFLVGLQGCGKKASIKRIEKPTAEAAQPENSDIVADVTENTTQPKSETSSGTDIKIKSEKPEEDTPASVVVEAPIKTTPTVGKPEPKPAKSRGTVIYQEPAKSHVQTEDKPAVIPNYNPSTTPSETPPAKVRTQTVIGRGGVEVTVPVKGITTTYHGTFTRDDVQKDIDFPKKPLSENNQAAVRIKYLEDLKFMERSEFKEIMKNEDKLTKKHRGTVQVTNDSVDGDNITNVLSERNQVRLFESNACRTEISGSCLLVLGDKVFLVGLNENSDRSQTLNLSEVSYNKSATECDPEEGGCFGPYNNNLDLKLKSIVEKAYAHSGPIAYSKFNSANQIDESVEQANLVKVLKNDWIVKAPGHVKATQEFIVYARSNDPEFFQVIPNKCKLIANWENDAWLIGVAWENGQSFGTIMCDQNGDGDASEDVTLVRFNMTGLGLGLGLQIKNEFPLMWFNIDRNITYKATGLSLPGGLHSIDLANCLSVGVKASASLYKYNPQGGLGIGSVCESVADGNGMSKSGFLALEVLYGLGETGSPWTIGGSLELVLVKTKDRRGDF